MSGNPSAIPFPGATIEEVIEYLRNNAAKRGITLLRPSFSYPISKLEKVIGRELPPEFITFYNFCDGFEDGEDMFRILPLEEIAEHFNKEKDNPFFLAEYMIYCDTWDVKLYEDALHTFEIIGYISDTEKIHWHSLSSFIIQFLTGGLYGKGGLYLCE